MHIGICGSAAANAKTFAAASLDYIEENVQAFLAPERDETVFRDNLKAASGAARNIVAANCFLPGHLSCTGDKVDLAALMKYGETAFARAERAGIDTIVFGSGKARQLPDGFDRKRGMDQFVELLKRLSDRAARHGVTVVVEPLNTGECNFITSLAEGAEAVRRCDHPNVRLLADIYHMLRDNEPESAIVQFGPLLAHVHIAEKRTRSGPGIEGDDFSPYLKALRSVNYDRRMSIEGGYSDMGRQLGDSLKALRSQLARCGYQAVALG